MKQILYLVLCLLLPSAIAFNCNSLSGGDLYICNQIQSTSLTSQEKDLLISDIFNKNKTTPNFDFVYSWNTNLNIANSPNGKTSSNGIINNAWIKIMAVMPSIIENNTLYAPDKSKILTAYNFDYKLPSGVEYKDCDTVYSLNSVYTTTGVYLNGNYIGSDKISSYVIYDKNIDNLNFKSELNIQVKYKVTHYRYKTINDRRRCRSYSTEIRTSNLQLSDSLNAKLYKNQLDSSFKITSEYADITRGILKANNFSNLVLSFHDSEYQNTKYIYSLNYALPYYVLTLRADKIENSKQKNILVEKNNNEFSFVVDDSSSCKIQLRDHFNSITKTCDMSFNKVNLSIKTDRLNYYEDETIKVYINPKVNINVTYANQTKTANDYVEFKAVLFENKITAKVNDNEENYLVNVTRKEDIDFLCDFSLISFLGYFFFKIAKFYLPII